MRSAFRFILLFIVLITNLWANTTTSSWYSQDSEKKITLNVDLFISSTCTYCHKADDFFREIEVSNPWLHVTRHVINENKEALALFNQMLTEQKMSDFAVPSIFFCNSRWVGFASPETTGKDLLHALNYCKQQIEKKGELTSESVSVLQRWANANLFDLGMTEQPTALKYITIVALMDAYNPCALFCFGGFFALLFMQDRRKDQLITGFLFIVSMGIVHFLQQVYASAFFELLPWFRWPAALVGIFTFYLAGQYYRKRSAYNLFFLLAVLLAWMIQSYQQTCVMNWSLIFEQWLNNQNLNSVNIALYELSYQVMFIVPWILTLIIYTILIQTKRLAKVKKKLNSIGHLYILVIGLFLIIYPFALSVLALSLFAIAGALIAGVIFSKFQNTENEKGS